MYIFGCIIKELILQLGCKYRLVLTSFFFYCFARENYAFIAMEERRYMKIPTHLNHTLTALHNSTVGYDKNIKELLADVQILARILKYSIRELQEFSVEELISCLTQTDIEVGERGVEPGITNLGKIQSTNTEDNILNEGYISFDIRFRFAYKEKNLTFIINIEAQKSSDSEKLRYHIESRMVYYLSRLISSQKNVEFSHSDYDNIKKVYSIWICMDTAEGADSIYEFSFKPELIYGSKYDYSYIDKMCGIIIRIRNDINTQESKNKLIEMLEDILSREESERKKKHLSEKYGIQMTTDLERRINIMCNLSENIVEYAMEHGYKEGIKEGIKEGDY